MTRNQQSPKLPSNLSGNTVFVIEGSGDISPDTQTTVARGDWIVLHKDPSLMASVTHVCAQQSDVCKCSILAVGISSGNHMVLGGNDTSYQINSSASVGTDYELYAATDDGPIENARTGDVHVGS